MKVAHKCSTVQMRTAKYTFQRYYSYVCVFWILKIAIANFRAECRCIWPRCCDSDERIN